MTMKRIGTAALLLSALALTAPGCMEKSASMESGKKGVKMSAEDKKSIPMAMIGV